MKTFAVVVRYSPSDTRLLARITRKDLGDVVAAWSVDEPRRPNRVPAWNPHVSYHASGQQHSKTHGRAWIRKHLQPPDSSFKGRAQLESTNASRMLYLQTACSLADFDEVLEIPVELVTGGMDQFVSVDLVEPGVEPMCLTGQDKVVLQKTFTDRVPWIVVTFGEAGEV